jgi:hypothetical protein
VSEIPGQMTVESVQADMIVHPLTGEVLDPRAIQTEALLEAHDLLLDSVKTISGMRRQVDDELVRRLDHEGRRSMSFEGFKVETNPPLEKEWNTTKLAIVLAELVEEELISSEKADKCVRHKPEPVWRELKTLLSDPRVRERIEACFEEVDARRYVKVSRHA